MRAAVLPEHGGTPRCDEFEEPPDRTRGVIVDVAAAALHHFDLHKASGTFYTGRSARDAIPRLGLRAHEPKHADTRADQSVQRITRTTTDCTPRSLSGKSVQSVRDRPMRCTK